MNTDTMTKDQYEAARALPNLDRDSARDGGFRAWLATEWQAGRCADCGETGHVLEFAHFHRNTGVYAVGLGAMTCRTCNLIHTHVADADGSLPWRYVEGFAVLPPSALPVRSVLTRYHREHQARATESIRQEAARRVQERL